jgi:hypothetical protein
VVLLAGSGCSRGKAVPKINLDKKASAGDADAKPAPAEPEAALGDPIRLAVPETPNFAWPWKVGNAEEPGPSHPIYFPWLQPYSITGFAVRSEVGRAVVTIRSEKKGQGIATRVLLCNTTTGKLLTEWVLPGEHAVLDLSPDGRSILSTAPALTHTRTSLRIWAIASDGQLRRWSWTAHTPVRLGVRCDPSGSAGSTEIRWAAFVGNDRVVSSSRGGQLRVFEADGGKPIASVEGVFGRPTLTPDGSKVAALIGNTVALIDPLNLSVPATCWIGNVPPNPVLAISPDGTRLAMAGNGKLTLLNLTNGELQQPSCPRMHVTDPGNYDKPFSWVGANLLYADGSVFDPRLPAPVWTYSASELVQFQGQRLWAVTQIQGSSSYTLGAQQVPDTSLTALVEEKLREPGVLSLKPGDAVRIEAEGIPEDRRGDVVSALEKRVRESGYRIDPTAATLLRASVVESGVKGIATYAGLEPCPYPKQPAQLRLERGSQELWSESWAIEAPVAMKVLQGMTLFDQLIKSSVGGPNYNLFSLAPIPAHLPGERAPTAPLGRSAMKSSRYRSWLPW